MKTEPTIRRIDRSNGNESTVTLAEAQRRVASYFGDDVDVSEIRRQLLSGEDVATGFAIYRALQEEPC